MCLQYNNKHTTKSLRQNGLQLFHDKSERFIFFFSYFLKIFKFF